MLLLILIFCLAILIPIFLKRKKNKRRVDAVFLDIKKWKSQVKEFKKHAGRSDLDTEKLEMAENRLTFAKNAYKIKMKR